jgi:Spy/CpxP family protein refolding chaperone
MSSRVRALAVLIAVLFAGCIFGAVGLRFWERRLPGDRGFPYSSRDQGRPDRLVERLQLTPEQQAQLKAILEDSRRQIHDGRLEMEQKMSVIRAQTNGKIAAILNDEQKKKFEQFLKEGESRRGSPGRRGQRNGRPPEY